MCSESCAKEPTVESNWEPGTMRKGTERSSNSDTIRQGLRRGVSVGRAVNEFLGRVRGWIRTASGLGSHDEEPDLSVSDRERRHERRSAWLRLAVLVILTLNLMLGEHSGNILVHANVLGGYALASAVALALSLSRRGLAWTGAAFVVVDALAIVALFHEHLFGSATALNPDHALTTTTFAIAFVLLNHVALRLRASLILLYAGLVLAGWISLLIVKGVIENRWNSPASAVLATDAALATAFAFAAFVTFLIIQEHGAWLTSALKLERRRLSLSRFFSPGIVAELQSGSVDLERRTAAVMFVDLRSFTHFAETAKPTALSELLVDYRTHVAQAVFDWGGTVDKFIGDGVMAVFGHPWAKPDDGERAIRCALQLSQSLIRWKRQRREEAKPALDAAIGLHIGLVTAGVLESGQHYEFTVVGDAVNVAQRLERLAKELDAVLVVSAAILERRLPSAEAVPWVWRDQVELQGREGVLKVAYLPRSSAWVWKSP
ncbi:MAG: adenylate/guanylate cyclase domain-containing protein [Reyranella sp.]|uniref:Adenylate cyclase n=1 Tax=Enhydrobacter aerosaccus TaxID=225324 RepID=A0A1T4SJT6_9HYPH|nr:MAG: adenylate cyclase [Rhodospirillaceae bacterium]TBR22026.1 MAG: adenylate/guanylate cyclase domain-containing protein [Reyranella sp.]SKA28469.1 adenylate cyclase [Enhydrobacter aerosaccus]